MRWYSMVLLVSMLGLGWWGYEVGGEGVVDLLVRGGPEMFVDEGGLDDT